MPKKANLVGQKFGRLTVVSEEGRDKHGRVTWRCCCDCGKSVSFSTNRLNMGAKDCGLYCFLRQPPKQPNAHKSGIRYDAVYGLLTVVLISGDVAHCMCACGARISRKVSELFVGTPSCGCHAEMLDSKRLSRRRCRALFRRSKKNGWHDSRHINLIYRHQGGECNGCGEKMPLSKLTHDHIVPLARGGSNRPENIQLLCHSCNSSKRANDFMEWVQKKHGWTEQRYIEWMLDRHQLNKRLKEIRC